MPYRAAGLLMALAGLVAVVGLVLIGIDVYAARQRGPRWKRRLLGAGLAVMGSLGFFVTSKATRVTCYVPTTIALVNDWVSALEKRLPLVEKTIEDEKLDPSVARKVLDQLEAETLQLYREEWERKGSNSQEHAHFLEVRGAAVATVARLRGRLSSCKDLQDLGEWKALCATWKRAEEVADGSRGLFPFEKADERFELLNAIDKAVMDADIMAKAGFLADGEARLLGASLRQYQASVSWKAAKDQPPVMCYKPSDPVQSWTNAHSATERLSLRLPLLQKLAGDGKLNPPVTARVLEAVETDLRRLQDEKDLGWLGAEERKKAVETREAVKAEVEKLKALLGAR